MPEFIKRDTADFRESMQLVRELDVRDPRFYALYAQMGYKIVSYRKENGGLPKGIFLKQLEMNGSYLCTEVILTDNHNNPVLKWRKDISARAGEKSWENKLHIPGLTVGGRLASEMLPVLLAKEVLADPNSIDKLPKAKLIGFGRLDESERKTIADTCYWQITLGKKHLKLLQPDFETIYSLNDRHVIDQHRPVLEWWALGKSRPPVFDTRQK